MIVKAWTTGKIIAVAAAAFGSVALVSTGTASFIISRSATQSVEGNAEFGTISDSRLQFYDVGFANEETDKLFDSITFDAIKDEKDGRFTYEEDPENPTWEHLTVTLKGSIGPATFLKRVTVKMDVVTEAGENLTPIDDAIEAGYIELVTWGEGEEFDYLHNPVEVPLSKIEGDEDNRHFEIVLGFRWGKYFNYENPCLYYDDKEEGGGWSISDTMAKYQMDEFIKTIHYGANYEGEVAEDELDKPKLTFLCNLVGEVN